MDLILDAPQGTRYLSEIMNGNLPKDCLFNKITTGCGGGTYVALTANENYIIAAPTRSLVRDKVLNPRYIQEGIQGVSSDYPLGDRDFKGTTKIITTYKSLEAVSKRLDISKWNLVVDEMHMLTGMTSYARQDLLWLLQNFKRFKSYCFMSATIPRNDHLLPELQNLDRVTVDWKDVEKVSFSTYLSDNIQESILQIIYEHHTGLREGNPYFFYNTISGITNVVKKLSGAINVKEKVAVVCADTERNKRKLKDVGLPISTARDCKTYNFVTATAFEGVDFNDLEGVTYVISDRRYDETKYSIETTIPQIIGRLRDSKYRNHVTAIFNEHRSLTTQTPEEFAKYLDTLELKANSIVKRYEEFRVSVEDRGTAEALLKEAYKNAFIEVIGNSIDIEYIEDDQTIDVAAFEVLPQIQFYPYIRAVMQQTYDLFHEEHYVRGDHLKPLGDITKLGIIKGKAPALTEEARSVFKTRRISLKTLCNQYEKDKGSFSETYPDWFYVIDCLGVDAIKALGFRKDRVLAAYEISSKTQEIDVKALLYSTFKVGKTYSKKFIVEFLEGKGIENPKSTIVKNYFKVTETTVKGSAAYRIDSKKKDFKS